MQTRFCAIIPAACAMSYAAPARAADLFVAIPGQILRLHDATGDGDFLDALEVLSFATNVGPNNAGIAFDGSHLFVAASLPPRILLVRDLNGDGDALDFAEVVLHAELPAGAAARQLRGLARMAPGRLLVVDQANGEMLEARDLTGDGDALDAGEVTLVAAGLATPRDIAVRPDGALLVAQSSTALPVMILIDRNGDGDFFDFAEQLSYVENMTPGLAVHALNDTIAMLAQTATGQLIQLVDWTGDGDALDANETRLFAVGITTAHTIAHDGLGGWFVAGQDLAGNIHRASDKNGDGDALDFAEVELVATGIAGSVDLALPLSDIPCIPGDANIDGSVNTADILAFADALVGPAPAELCRFDLDGDSQVDGRDVPVFAALLLQ